VKRALIQSTTFIQAAKRFVKKHSQSLENLGYALSLLETDAFDPRLRTHKLKGEMDGSWACSAGYDLRIVFDFVEHNGVSAILLLSLGTHDEVY